MNEEVRRLFHEVADLPQPERDRILGRAQIGPDVRAEVESLLSFDSDNPDSLTDYVPGTAEETLHS